MFGLGLLLVTHSLILIGRRRQQDEREDHGKAADGVQLAVGKRGAQLLPGTFLCKRQNLKTASRSRSLQKQKGHSQEATLSSRMRLFHLMGRGGPAVLPAGEERAVEGFSVGVVV